MHSCTGDICHFRLEFQLDKFSFFVLPVLFLSASPVNFSPQDLMGSELTVGIL